MGKDQPARSGQRRGRPHRRDLILQAAKELFAANGFHETGMSDIGRAAGVTGSAIYRHFKSKDELLVSLFDQLWDRIDVTLQRVAGLPAADALDKLVRDHIALALEDGHIVDLWAQRRSSVPAHYLRAAERHLEHWLNVWGRFIFLVRPELTPEQAYHIASAVIGAINSAAYTAPRLDDEGLADVLYRVVWGGMLGNRPGEHVPAAPAAGG
jgi:AcrR family transcriptional regulator